jgi:hypothetical protein
MDKFELNPNVMETSQKQDLNYTIYEQMFPKMNANKV